jgi:hypothetical protein
MPATLAVKHEDSGLVHAEDYPFSAYDVAEEAAIEPTEALEAPWSDDSGVDLPLEYIVMDADPEWRASAPGTTATRPRAHKGVASLWSHSVDAGSRTRTEVERVAAAAIDALADRRVYAAVMLVAAVVNFATLVLAIRFLFPYSRCRCQDVSAPEGCEASAATAEKRALALA